MREKYRNHEYSQQYETLNPSYITWLLTNAKLCLRAPMMYWHSSQRLVERGPTKWIERGGGHYSYGVPHLYSWVNQERQVFLTESRNEANGKSSGSMQTPRTYLDYYIYILFTESGQDAPLIWGEQYDTNRWKPVRLCLSVHRLYSPSVQQQNRRKKLTANSGSYSIQR